MRVKYFFNWGYFYPPACGADQVALNHMQYFRDRGWEVDCILAHNGRKKWAAEAFRAEYPWIRSVTVGRVPRHRWQFGEILRAYDEFADLPVIRAALSAPADVFVTNYVFSAPLVRNLPAGCRRVLESHDIMSDQFALAGGPADSGKPAAAIQKYCEQYFFRTEMDLYRLFDAVIMINRDETHRVRRSGASNAHYVPRWYPMRKLPEVPEPPTYDLLIVASASPINQAGIEWFYRHVYEGFLSRRGVRLAIAGGVCESLDYSDANVKLLGRVEGPLDRLYAESALVIAPIFEGTGLSIKTVEALAMGKALVAAPAAARGLDAEQFVTIDMKESPAAVADAILRLLANPQERRHFETKARAYAQREFSLETFSDAMDRVFQSAGIAPRSTQRLSA